MSGDVGQVDGQQGRLKRGGDGRSRGRGNWLVSKINKKCFLNKKEKPYT